MLESIRCNPRNFNFENFQIFDLVPALIFIRDINHRYVYCNVKNAYALGVDNPKEIIGQLAYMVSSYPSHYMDEIIRNDLQVIREKQTLTFNEWYIDHLGEISRCYIQKSPILNDHGEVIGVIGVGIESVEESDSVADDTDLSERQIECLHLIAKGRSYKEVASSLKICERTVRFHVNNMKKALNVYSRSQLIDYYYQNHVHRA